MNGSVVSLSGEGRALEQIDYVTSAALRVHGVSAVVNDVSVRIARKAAHPDRGIAEAVKDSIFWMALVPFEQVQIVVSDEVVRLGGELDGNFQRREAKDVARRIVGVQRVDNEITLSGRAGCSVSTITDPGDSLDVTSI